MGDDPAEYIMRVQRWLALTEQEVAGDQALRDKIEELAGQALQEHIAQHLRSSIVTTPAADALIQRAKLSTETIANAHLAEHWASPNNRSCVPIGGRGAETLVVRHVPQEARTYIWRLGEGEEDPAPETIEEWRRASRQ
jgi:hypothetical protein